MPLPASLDTITVTGTFLDHNGDPQSGTVRFTTTQLLQSSSDNLFITPGAYETPLDVNGSFSIDLPATDDPEWVPQGYTYQLAVTLENFTRIWSIAIPWTTPGGTVDLADVLPNEDVNAPASYVLRTSVGAVGGPAGPLDINGRIPAIQLPVQDVIPGTLVDAKGDILVGKGDNLPGRLAVGADGLVLKANSATETGLEWAADSGGGVGGIDPTLLDAKGDLIIATAGDTPARLAVGADGTFLKADSSATEGASWGTLTENDMSAAVIRQPTAMQVVLPDGTLIWLRVTLPYSASDTNEDFLQVRAYHSDGTTAIKTFWLNGNGEVRIAPSTPARVAERIYEIAEAIAAAGSTGNVWEVSTNPTLAGSREAYWSVRGNNHATQPGWMVGTRPFQATTGRFTGNLTVDGDTTLNGAVTADPLTWTSLTLSGVTAKSDESEPTPASTVDPFGLVSLRGTVEWALAISSGVTFATIANVNHRPSGRRTFSVRTGPPSNVSTELNIDNDGGLALIVASGASGRLGLDGIHFRL